MAANMRISSLIVAASLVGCGLFGGQKQASEQPAEQKPVVEQASKDLIRQGEQQAFQAATAELDKPEEDVKKALELSLGRIPAYQGGQNPYPASQSITELRKAKIDIRIEPVVDQNGKPVANDFVQLKDSYTDRVQELSRKMAEQKASKKEMKELQDGAPHMVKLNDLRSQVMAASLPAMQSGWLVTSSALGTMMRTSAMVRSRRQYEMEWTDEDYELVRQALEVQRRAETLAAISLGTLAAYQAVVDGADPQALDAVAEESLKLFPIKGEATLDDAKAYVAALGENIASTKERYEAQMRATYGDTVYEQQYKAGIDAMFAQVESSMTAKSATEIANEANAKYQEDIIKCYKGEEIDPGSIAAGPTCDEYARCGRGEMPNGPAVTPEKCEEVRQLAGGGPNIKGAGKQAFGALMDKASGMFPADGAIGSALAGVQALRNRDPRGAINAAVNLVPPGPAKIGLRIVAKIINAMPKIRRNADRIRQHA